jgi:transglutaminase-like putative cysteine protease
MSFDTYFKLTSYAVVLCGAMALFVSDGIGLIVTLSFVTALFFAFRFEETRWEISERSGLVLIIFSLPLFYFDWQFLNAILTSERAGAATLAHLILWLCLIKLWQKKSDRDWVFLYLISFFEILLAAGLSITPLFLAVLILYLLFSICTIVAFEIRKTKRAVNVHESNSTKAIKQTLTGWRLPGAAVGVLCLIVLLAVPLFFMMPRIGGAGFGRGSSGLSGMVGFSDTVTLGSIGKLQQNNQVVMRIRVEEPTAARNRNLRWRGVALDKFDKSTWQNTLNDKEVYSNQSGLFRIEAARPDKKLTIQTVYLEPTEIQILFGAPQILAVQANFPSILRDKNGALMALRQYERSSYKVISDTSQPDENILRKDNLPYSQQNAHYLQLPKKVDARIESLAGQIIKNNNAANRYDAARAIETYLQTQFGYTLEQKSNGEDPLAKFLFDEREGHCEYFATALAVMLRTQGIATRVVNGFQAGNYNNAADAYIVTQAQAHSWVEVYFPETDSWITFDPTPAAGRNIDAGTSSNFFAAGIAKYLEAAEMFWLQYVVGFDNQEQRSLVRNVRNNLIESQEGILNFWYSFQSIAIEWIKELRGEKGFSSRVGAVAKSVLILIILAGIGLSLWFGIKYLRRYGFSRIIMFLRKPNEPKQVVLFYERMIRALDKKGLRRQPQQTPLEFASELKMSEAVKITEAYNRVRFGNLDLSRYETVEIESWLQNLENASV